MQANIGNKLGLMNTESKENFLDWTTIKLFPIEVQTDGPILLEELLSKK